MNKTTLTPTESTAFHHNLSATGRTLQPRERERLALPYLPQPTTPSTKHYTQRTRFHRPHIRPLLTYLLYLTVFHLIQLTFTIYIHLRRTYHNLTSYITSTLYYHHRSPELIRRDVRHVSRLPQHLSLIVDLANDDAPEPSEALAKLVADVSEAAAWCACAGIPMLSIYERTGALKTHMATLDRALHETMRSYFPPENAPRVRLRAPLQTGTSPSASRSPSPPDQQTPATVRTPDLDLLLLSAADGRATLVDLTKTLAEMAQKRKLAPSDITTSLIDAEVTESSCGEPDLLVVMAPSDISGIGGRRVRRRRRSRRLSAVNGDGLEEMRKDGGGGGDICLRGYPPWQARLTEIFHVKDGRGVDYQTFLRALHRYAKAEFRLGR